MPAIPDLEKREFVNKKLEIFYREEFIEELYLRAKHDIFFKK